MLREKNSVVPELSLTLYAVTNNKIPRLQNQYFDCININIQLKISSHNKHHNV